MIRISQIKLPIDHSRDALENKICQQLNIKKEELVSWEIRRRSVDARKKPELYFVYTIDVTTSKNKRIEHRLKKDNHKNIMLTNPVQYTFPPCGEENDRTSCNCGNRSSRSFLRMDVGKSRIFSHHL